MKSVTLKVEGMSCNGCAERIRTSMAAQPGVKSADVSFAQGQARVLYDQQATDENRLVDAVEKLGFHVMSRTAS